MDKILAAQGLRVRWLANGGKGPAKDQERYAEASWRVEQSRLLTPWQGRFDPAARDFVVLVSGSGGEQWLGILAASERHTGREPFLLLEAAYLAPAARGRNLLQRMVGVALLNLSRFDRMPAAIAACVQDEAVARGLRGLCRHVGGMAAFPQPETKVVDLAMAGLAQRIARVVRPGSQYAAGSASFADYAVEHRLVILALDAAQEAQIAADARRLYQRPPTRQAVAEEFAQGHCGEAVAAAQMPRDEAMR